MDKELERANVISALEQLIQLIRRTKSYELDELLEQELCVNRLMDEWAGIEDKRGVYKVMSLRLKVERRPIR